MNDLNLDVRFQQIQIYTKNVIYADIVTRKYWKLEHMQ